MPRVSFIFTDGQLVFHDFPVVLTIGFQSLLGLSRLKGAIQIEDPNPHSSPLPVKVYSLWSHRVTCPPVRENNNPDVHIFMQTVYFLVA